MDQGVRRISIVLAAATLLAVAAAGNGFKNPPDGAAAFGDFGGKAKNGDATAIHHNPANLVDLESLTLTLALTPIYSPVEFTSASGASQESKDNFFLLPNMYVAMPVGGRHDVVLGLGITSPYGRSATWERNGLFAGTAPHFGELIVVNVNPTVAWRLSPELSVGVGLDVYLSTLKSKEVLATGSAEIDSDGIGIGGNIGITWLPAPRHRLALTYRSEVSVDYSGSFDVTNVAGVGNSSFDTDIDFPAVAACAYGLEVSDRLYLELDFEWLEYSTVNAWPLNLGSNSFLQGLGYPSSIQHHWENSFVLGFGGDWQIDEKWTFHFGYSFLETPVPDAYHQPTIVDADKNTGTVGLAYHSGANKLSFAYAISLYAERQVEQSKISAAYNGNYDVITHIFGLSYSHDF